MSLQRLWKDSREWSGLDNAAEQRGIGRAAPGVFFFFSSFFFYCAFVCMCVLVCMRHFPRCPSPACGLTAQACVDVTHHRRKGHILPTLCAPSPLVYRPPPTPQVFWLLPPLTPTLPPVPASCPPPSWDSKGCYLTRSMTLSRGASLTVSSLMAKIWSPGRSLPKEGPSAGEGGTTLVKSRSGEGLSPGVALGGWGVAHQRRRIVR